MTDNIVVTPGTGKTVLADEVSDGTLGTGIAQFVKIMDGTLDSTNKAVVTAAGALKVDGSGVTQPVSGTIAATQSGTFTVQPGNTPNTTAWKVDGSAVTQPVSGTISAAQSGTWNVTNVSGTISLPTGAATAAKQPALGTAGSASSDVLSVQGIVSMTPLKTDGSGVTQPVSGTVAATQSGAWNVRVQDGGGTALTAATRGSERALSVQIVDGSGTQITSFGGAGGTSSNFGSAFPAPGTAVGFTDGTSMRGAFVLDLDSGAGAEFNLGMSLRKAKSGGSVPYGTSTDPFAVTGAGSAGTADTGVLSIQGIGSMTPVQVSQATAASLNATVVGTGTFATQAAQSGTWSARIQDGSGNLLTSAVRGSERPLSVQIVDGSGAQITSFGGSGGTASNFGSALPSSGTAAGFSDGTNMQAPRVFDTNSGAGTEYTTGVNIRISGSSGSVEGGTSTNPLNVVFPSAQAVILTSTTITGTVAVTQSGSWSLSANQSTNIAQINGVTPLMGNGVTGTGSHRVTIASDSSARAVGGEGATAATAPSGAVQAGARAQNAEATAVTNGQMTGIASDLVGKQIILPFANPENFLTGTITSPMTGTTDTAVSGMGAQGSGVRNYITSVTICNDHATVGTVVVLKDGSAGTVLWSGPAAAAFGGVAIAFPTPLKTTANTGLFAANLTTGSSVRVSCTGYKGI